MSVSRPVRSEDISRGSAQRSALSDWAVSEATILGTYVRARVQMCGHRTCMAPRCLSNGLQADAVPGCD